MGAIYSGPARVDVTSPSAVAEAVADTVQDAALVALENLGALGLKLYGAGIVNNVARLEFAETLAAGTAAVRQSAGELVTLLGESGEEYGAEHETCGEFVTEAGESAGTLAAILAKLADEVERGWLYGDGLVRTLDLLARAAGSWADIVVTGRPAEFEAPTLYLSNVPAELAGMVAL